MVMAAATAAVTRRVGAGTGNRMRRKRATARTTMAPTSPTKLGANTPSPGTAAPTVSAAAATAATTLVASASTGQPPKGGSRSTARALLSANCHRADRPRTSASSACIAIPHSRRWSGRVATAAASSRPGGSFADRQIPVRDHQWSRSSSAAVTQRAVGTARSRANSRLTLAADSVAGSYDSGVVVITTR